MENKTTNRLKVVLAEKNRSSKWLAEQLKKNETTVSRRCTNETHPSIDILSQIVPLLDIDIRDLILSTKSNIKS